MKQKTRRSRFAQRRIDYIVYGNPKAVRNLVEEFGYEAPRDIHDLVSASSELIRKKGRKVVKELIKLHPDRPAILKVEKIKEDSYCAACNSYSYNPESNYCGGCGHSNYSGSGHKETFLEQLIDKSTKELEAYYERILQKSNKTPQDKDLAEEVQLTFHELTKRKKEETDDSKSDDIISDRMVIKYKDGMLILGLTLLAGIIVGTSFKKVNHG